jgi:hypothetical protein
MAIRDKLRSLYFSLWGMGAVDHPANGGITGEQYPEEESEAGEGSEE